VERERGTTTRRYRDGSLASQGSSLLAKRCQDEAHASRRRIDPSAASIPRYSRDQCAGTCREKRIATRISACRVENVASEFPRGDVLEFLFLFRRHPFDREADIGDVVSKATRTRPLRFAHTGEGTPRSLFNERGNGARYQPPLRSPAVETSPPRRRSAASVGSVSRARLIVSAAWCASSPSVRPLARVTGRRRRRGNGQVGFCLPMCVRRRMIG